MTPYKSILYHMDLSIMAYHLYAQVLIGQPFSFIIKR